MTQNGSVNKPDYLDRFLRYTIRSAKIIALQVQGYDYRANNKALGIYNYKYRYKYRISIAVC